MRAEICTEVTAAARVVVPAMPFQPDANALFSPPADAPWGRITFVDGAETFVSVGGTSNLAREPVLVYVDLFLPLGSGDGLAGELATAVRNALRRLAVTGARWHRFEAGTEGPTGADYRKQVVAVFHRTLRV